MKKQTEIVKPVRNSKNEAKSKVKMGTGKDYAYMSDTLFDDDLK